MPKILIPVAIVVALAVGIAIGFFVGRSMLERKWADPLTTITPDAEKRASAGEADPTPKAGTKILKAMPVGRARAALKTFTEKDPLVAAVSDFGSGDNGIELHVVVENRGKCAVTEMSGVAYGFDAFGMPAKANKNGETYVAFASDAGVEPGKKVLVAQLLKNAGDATIAIAQVDHAKCADGTTWARP